MRSNYVAEAILICLLIFVGAAAMTAWTIARARGKQNASAVEPPVNRDVVAVATKAVQKYAPYHLRLGAGDIYVDERSVEAPEPIVKGPLQSWLITGSAYVDAIDGKTFHWLVRVEESVGKMTLREVRVDGELIFDGAEAVEVPRR